MRYLSTFGLLILLIFWSSCRSDFETVESTGNLKFSTDTVYLDTVFTTISSATYALKVYNRTNEDLNIPSISLKKGEASAYRLNVDGVPGKSFMDMEVLANDSIYIFIETTVNLQQRDQPEFIYEDHLQFRSENHLQEIPILTLVKDAIFLYPKKDENGIIETIPTGTNELGEEVRVQGFYLNDEQLNFSNEKPYVIYGYAAVPSGKTLNIAPGARIHFHSESGIIVSENASLHVNGTFSIDREKLENEVIFQSDRLESQFQEIPGQWGAIWIQEGSVENMINYTTIKNASIGLLVNGDNTKAAPNLQLKNSQIYNSSVNGIRATNAKLFAENLVVNNSGQASVQILGGNYIFKHATLVNYWQQGYREYPAVYLQNFRETKNGLEIFDLDLAKFSNCIIFGNENIELFYYRTEEADFNLHLENCLIKFDDPSAIDDPLYDFNNPDYYQNIILNENPYFWNPLDNNFSLQKSSPAIDVGNLSTAMEVPKDLLQNDRTGNPDLGAYEWITSQNEE